MNKRNILVYISGLYSNGETDKNIKTARDMAIKIWEADFVAITPHLNTMHFEKDCKCKYEDYIEGDIEILKRCDCIYALPNWKKSDGAKKELTYAMQNNILIVESIAELEENHTNLKNKTNGKNT